MIPSAEQEQQLQVIADNVSQYDFYRLVEGLNRLAGIDPARTLGLPPVMWWRCNMSQVGRCAWR